MAFQTNEPSAAPGGANLAPVLAEAIRIAREAGALLRDLFGRPRDVGYKGKIDLVTDADRAAEELILERIAGAFPDHAALAEESAGGRAQRPDPMPAYLWVVDPLDGTTNYAHGLPVYAVSIGLMVEGTPALGVVYDPSRDELYHGGAGLGAYLNDRPIRVSAEAELERAILATGFPYDLRVSEDNNLDNFTRFCYASQAIRRLGSASLDLCYVACGRLDGFWELKLHAWDTAAAAAFLPEAGARITDYSGGPFDVFGLETLASNALIHEPMIRVIASLEP
jgi:myo-inositol-1(or 4)-monophosphatase